MDALAQFRAIDDIRQLKSRYFRFLDTKDWDGMATIFTADAVFDLRAGGKVGTDFGPEDEANIFRGRDAIIAYLSGAMVGSVSVHHGHGHEVTVDARDRAHGIIALEDIINRADNGALILQGYGHYHEHYAREDGQWRIAQSRLSRLKVTLGTGFE